MSFSLLPVEPDGAKSKGFAKFLAWGLGLGAAIVIAPFVFLMIGGIVGVAAALGVTYAALKFAPVFGMMTSNLALKAIRWEARRNPVETKMQIYKEDKEQTDAFEKECSEFNDQVEAYRNQIAGFVKKYPAEAPTFLEELRGYEELRGARYEALRDMRANLVLQSEDIERSTAIWDMTKASDRMGKLAGRLSQKDATRQIMESEANKAIEDGRARARAAMIHIRNTQAGLKSSAPAAIAPATPTATPMLEQGADNVFSINSAQRVADAVPVQKKG